MKSNRQDADQRPDTPVEMLDSPALRPQTPVNDAARTDAEQVTDAAPVAPVERERTPEERAAQTFRPNRRTAPAATPGRPMPAQLAHLHDHWARAVSAVESEAMSEAEARLVVEALVTEDAAEFLWGISFSGEFLRRDGAHSNWATADPSAFVTAEEQDAAAAAIPAPREVAVRAPREPSRIAQGVRNTVGSAGSVVSGLAGRLRRERGPRDQAPEMKQRDISKQKWVGMIAGMVVVVVLISRACSPDAPPPPPLNEASDPGVVSDLPTTADELISVMSRDLPFVPAASARCLADGIVEILDGRMKRPVTSDTLASLVASAAPSESESVKLESLVSDGQCVDVRSAATGHFAASGTALDLECVTTRVAPAAQRLLVAEITGQIGQFADTQTLAQVGTVCAPQATPATPDTGSGGMIVDIDGPTADDARAVVAELMSGDPTAVAARFLDDRDVPSVGDQQSSAALFVGLREAGATGVLMEVDVTDRSARQVVGIHVSGIKIGELQLDWAKGETTWGLDRWPQYSNS